MNVCNMNEIHITFVASTVNRPSDTHLLTEVGHPFTFFVLMNTYFFIEAFSDDLCL